MFASGSELFQLPITRCGILPRARGDGIPAPLRGRELDQSALERIPGAMRIATAGCWRRVLPDFVSARYVVPSSSHGAHRLHVLALAPAQLHKRGNVRLREHVHGEQGWSKALPAATCLAIKFHPLQRGHRARTVALEQPLIDVFVADHHWHPVVDRCDQAVRPGGDDREGALPDVG